MTSWKDYFWGVFTGALFIAVFVWVETNNVTGQLYEHRHELNNAVGQLCDQLSYNGKKCKKVLCGLPE